MNSFQEIKIHNDAELTYMKKSCHLARDVLIFIEPYIKEGVTTEELNQLCHKYIIEHDATSATLNYKGFPKSVCTSVNHVVCHGIPGDYKLKAGDIINIDVTVILDGWHGDTSKTFLVGQCSKLAERLVQTAEEALYVGIEAAKPFGHFGDIGKAIQKFIKKSGFSIVMDYCGHGIGQEFHASPTILHFDSGQQGEQILPGMFFTIEPMINAGNHKTKLLKDGWTVVTVDKSLSAQFEHTIAVMKNKIEILT
ncbi:MAG: type I methionyl aminopeptidase [Holosporales bacterium]|jgi:methionyl aminopeptidase|nr:type I methionyl aminopeptidase [Holosporales bacterium]